VLSNERETPTTRRVRLALDGAPFPYRAGQAASLAAAGKPTPYSIASAPTESRHNDWVEFLVKVDGASRFGAVVERLQPGVLVKLGEPVGGFTLDRIPEAAPLLLVAGGTGIAPMRSMIREAIATGRGGPLSLVYSSRTPDEFAYLTELRALSADGKLKLKLTLTGDAADWSHARGRAGAGHFADDLAASTVAFVCGPPAMVTEVPAALASLGVPRDRIITENW
jgi:ferredoxin-NADP reductase